jgi:hypothetical protein
MFQPKTTNVHNDFANSQVYIEMKNSQIIWSNYKQYSTTSRAFETNLSKSWVQLVLLAPERVWALEALC